MSAAFCWSIPHPTYRLIHTPIPTGDLIRPRSPGPTHRPPDRASRGRPAINPCRLCGQPRRQSKRLSQSLSPNQSAWICDRTALSAVLNAHYLRQSGVAGLPPLPLSPSGFPLTEYAYLPHRISNQRQRAARTPAKASSSRRQADSVSGRPKRKLGGSSKRRTRTPRRASASCQKAASSWCLRRTH